MAPKSPWKNTKQPKANNNAVKAGAEQPAPNINYGEVQAEEVEVLKAIYMEDYEEVEIKGAWSKTTDRSFKLRLRSFSDNDSLVVLSVKLTATYPKTAPLLEITGLDVYHERTQKRVRNIVQNRPRQLLGEVMIHAIASEIQEALEDAVSARQQGTLPSLEEERASAEEVATTLAKEAEEAEARRQREAQEEEDRVLKQMVDEEVNRREKRRPVKAAPVPSQTRDDDDLVSFDQPANLQIGNETLQFNTVDIINLLSRSRDGHLYLGRPSVQQDGPLVAVKRLTVRKDREQIMEIESYLDVVRKLRHPGTLALLAFRVDRLDSLSSDVTLCSEYADRGTLLDVLQLGTLHPSKARHLMIVLLEALDHLHRNGIAHGSLLCSTVYLQGSPISPRLGQLGQWKLQPEFDALPVKWRAPEDVTLRSKASDIWQLAVVAAQMFLGLSVTDEYHSPHTMLGRLDLSDAFDDFLRKAWTLDPKKRPSAFDLLPAEFLRTDAAVLETNVPLTTERKPSSGLMSPAKRRSRHNSSHHREGDHEPLSRYAADFTEIGRLGKGGFGEVVKARNKLDGGVYAVKKVKQAPQLLDQVLSEVMLLNRLNHPYVVRYYSTWVESDFTFAGITSSDDATSTTEETTVEEAASSDGPRMDFGGGYTSTGGLDFVSSSGYPQIEFGDDSDSDGDSDADSTSSQLDNGPRVNAVEPKLSNGGELHLKRSRSDSHRLPSMLYIQMEYCERHTLRDLVRKGMSSDDSWRFARQITEGLAHIHGHGIIHRDLKPDNVFIDVAGNPKIGDFGLATTSQYHFAERAATMSGQSGGDMTRSVGTALYVAPELRSGSSGSYNDKVDMYSLGIMFYEMCEEFSTAMERIRAIQHVREKNSELPPAYRAGGAKAAQGKLITCLISHKPSDRPTSNELLRSDVLPVKIEDETIRQALSGLSDPRSPYHQKIMSALFSRDAVGADRVKALAWDAKGSSVPEDAVRLRLRSVAIESIQEVFRRHGAEEARRESLLPRSGFYTNTNVVQLLDASGNLVQLPYDLTLPHARQLAKHVPSIKRTFTIASAYRDAFTGGPPKASDEVDFDVSQTANDHEPNVDDAEVLKVVDEIVCTLPSFASMTVLLHLNHMAILDAVLELCRVPLVEQPSVKEMISRLGFHQWTWSKVRAELRKSGLPDTTLDDLQQFDFRETPDKAAVKLKAMFDTAGSRLKASLERGLRSLQEIIRTTHHLSLQRKIVIVPLGSVNAKFYQDGMLFQCVLERKSNRTVIAAGGRYDNLIHAHRTISSTTHKACTGAVGVSIGLDTIVAHMARSGAGTKRTFVKDQKHAENLPKRCDVLVDGGPTDGSKEAALRVLASLWANDISAELAIDSRTAVEDIEHSFVAAIRHEASQSVRVSSAASDSEEIDVPTASLVSHLQQELRERETNKTRPPTFVRQASHHDPDRKSNVQVLLAQHRSKKSNKYHIVEAAQQRWSEKIDEWKDAPILAVETSDAVLDLIRETRISDAETWRKAVQGVHLNERQYLGQVQDILSTWRKQWAEGDGGREACIFNFRTSNCIYYDLGL